MTRKAADAPPPPAGLRSFGDGARTSEVPLSSEDCSIAGTLEAVGDSWSILVLRELFFGVHRFNDLQRDLGVSRSVL